MKKDDVTKLKQRKDKRNFSIVCWSSCSLPFSGWFTQPLQTSRRYMCIRWTFFTTSYTNRSQCHSSEWKENFDRRKTSILPNEFTRSSSEDEKTAELRLCFLVDPETRFFLPLSLSLSFSLSLSADLRSPHTNRFAEVSLVKVARH